MYKTNTLIIRPQGENAKKESKQINNFKVLCRQKEIAYKDVIMGWVNDYLKKQK
jgi:hypothetical protein